MHQNGGAAEERERTEARQHQASVVAGLGQAVEAGCVDEVMTIIREDGHLLLAPGFNEVLDRAFALLADGPESDDPVLAATEALLRRVQLRADDAAAASALAQRWWMSASRADPRRQIDERVAAVLVWRVRCGWGSPSEAIATARACLGCNHGDAAHAQHRLGAGTRLVWSGLLLVELATTEMLVGDLEEARVHAAEAISLTRMIGHERLLAVALGVRSFLETVDGHYESAAATARESLTRRPTNGDLALPYVARIQWVLGWAAVQRMDTAVARDHLAAAEEQAGTVFDPALRELLTLLRVLIAGQEGDLTLARTMLGQQVSTPFGAVHLARLREVVGAHTAVLSLDARQVCAHARGLRAIGEESEGAFFDAVGRALGGERQEALLQVADLLRRTDLHPVVVVGACSLRVAMLLLLDRRDEAAELIPDLVVAAEPHHVVEAMTAGLLAGGRFLDLLRSADPGGLDDRFVADALEALSRSPLARGAGSARLSTRRPAGEIRLTARESVVLRELAEGGSYLDIARALFISENTVKTHVGAVYRKLGADRRGAALRRAREQGLL